MRLIEADTLSNQNISTELLAGSYTADAELAVFARVFLTGIAGNGAYRASVFVQRRGAGGNYRHIPAGGDYVFVASGVTTVCATTDTVPLETTDVMTVYVTGLAADTTTPDMVVEFWEADTNDTTAVVLSSGSLSNQNIAAELLVGSYIAADEGAMFARVFISQIAGDGAYRARLTVQRRGAGGAYQNVASVGDYSFVRAGVTDICLVTETVPVAPTDVLAVYVTGMPTDTTTPDIVVEFWKTETTETTLADAVWASASRTLTGSVTLADDAITAAKFDESTAFPLKSADTGATAVARTGADSDTLETISDQIDDVPTNAELTSGLAGADDATLAAIAALNNLSSAQAQVAAAAALTAYDPPTDAEMDAALLVIRGADGDTLETLSDQLDAQEPADVWGYTTRTLTTTAAQVTAAVAAGVITIHRGDSLSASLTGLGNISARSKLWFTVKGAYGDADSAAIIQIEETAGLVYLNGAAGTAAQGDITVDDAVAGDITITMAAAATAALGPQSGLAYDVQVLDASGVTTRAVGECDVSADVTRAVS